MQKQPAPYGLEIIQNCLTCPVREGTLFCNLSDQAVTELNSIRQTSVYPAGAVLFVEGQRGHGVFILCSGKAKLTASSPQGRSVIIRVAGAGEVLGLDAAISDTIYVATAETLEPTQVNYLPRPEFLRFLQNHGEVAVRTVKHLSVELRRAYQQISRVVLSPAVPARLAGLLLETAANGREEVLPGTRFQLRFTHQEIGELIGTSRETVSRVLSDFRRKKLVQVRGANVTLLNPNGLRAFLE